MSPKRIEIMYAPTQWITSDPKNLELNQDEAYIYAKSVSQMMIYLSESPTEPNVVFSIPDTDLRDVLDSYDINKVLVNSFAVKKEDLDCFVNPPGNQKIIVRSAKAVNYENPGKDSVMVVLKYNSLADYYDSKLFFTVDNNEYLRMPTSEFKDYLVSQQINTVYVDTHYLSCEFIHNLLNVEPKVETKKERKQYQGFEVVQTKKPFNDIKLKPTELFVHEYSESSITFSSKYSHFVQVNQNVFRRLLKKCEYFKLYLDWPLDVEAFDVNLKLSENFQLRVSTDEVESKDKPVKIELIPLDYNPKRILELTDREIYITGYLGKVLTVKTERVHKILKLENLVSYIKTKGVTKVYYAETIVLDELKRLLAQENLV